MTGDADTTTPATGEGAPVAVLLCEHLQDAGRGLDLATIRQRVEEASPGVSMGIVPALCDRPIDPTIADGEGDRLLVQGLCRGDFARIEMERSAREAGLDPLGIQTVDLAGLCASIHEAPESTEKAYALLAAAIARARAFPGSLPEHVMPRFAPMGQRVSRRALFSVPPLHYQPVATLDRKLCAAEQGCRRCVQVCPLDAVQSRGQRVIVDRNRCDACGLCVVECPRAALDLPGDSPAMLVAEIDALLESPAPTPSEQRAPLFVCRANEPGLAALGEQGLTYPATWLPVAVPCTGAVTAATILGALAAGADAVGVIACGGDCHFGQAQRVGETVDYCRQLLDAVDGSPDTVRLLSSDNAAELAQALGEPLEDGARPGTNRAESRRRMPATTAEAVLALADAHEASGDVWLAHSASPFGLVKIDTEACTACGTCGRLCPTSALVFEERDASVALTFDAALCTGCGLCVGRCPENVRQAVSVQPVTNVEALRSGRVTLHEDEAVRCEVCGSVIGPAGMLGRIEELLGGDLNAAGLATIRQRCPTCRGIG